MPHWIHCLTNNDISLPDSVVVALASSKAGEMFKFRLINHFKNTTFAQNPVPKIYLNALTVEQLELEVLPSELYREIDVLKIIVAKQKSEILKDKKTIDDQKVQIENLNRNESTKTKQISQLTKEISVLKNEKAEQKNVISAKKKKNSKLKSKISSIEEELCDDCRDELDLD